VSENKELLEQTKKAIADIERAMMIYKFKQTLDRIGLGDGTTKGSKPRAIAVETQMPYQVQKVDFNFDPNP
jgi:hypothetical protein